MDIFLDWLSNGLVGWNAVGIVLVTLGLTHITIASVTIYLHRHAAHRALDLHPAVAHFFRFWLWLTTGMVTKEWAAIHRKHHAKCETEEDPHSPQVMGLGEIFWRGAEAYRAAAVPETLDRYGAGCPDDWVERNVYTKHSALGIALMLIINVSLFGAIGLTVWAVQMAWIPITAAGVINGIGHYWGYRNFECADAARNIVPWGILIGGEELHNNHHTYPNSAKLSVKGWEFDIGWMYIRILEILGLAKARSTGPIAQRQEGKSALDPETAWAILNDRFEVMARYSKLVVGPAVRAEYNKADVATRRALKRARTALTRHEIVVTDRHRERIANAVSSSEELRLIYELRVKLNEIWGKRGNAEELLSDLKAWCVAAEDSGLQTLRDFVDELKSYTVPRPALA